MAAIRVLRKGSARASTSSEVHAGFVALPSGWPVLGVGAEANWADGAPTCSLPATLGYGGDGWRLSSTF
jgi:hypothetical protein